MQQKDYKAIAKIIGDIRREYLKDKKQSVVGHGLYTTARITKGLVDYFEKEYPDDVFSEDRETWIHDRFKRSKFLKDCGVE